MAKKLLILLTLLLLISGCKNAAEKVDTPLSDNNKETTLTEMAIFEESGMKNVFASVVTNLEFKLKFMHYGAYYFNKMFYLDGRIYIASDRFKEGNERKEYRENESGGGYHMNCNLLSFDTNGENMELREITQVNPDPLSDVIFMWYDSEFNQITIEDYKFEYTLHKRTFDDELIFSLSLKDVFGDFVIHSMVIGEDDNIYIAGYNILMIVSKDGEILKTITSENSAIYEVSSAHGKKPIFMKAQQNGLVYEYFDMETETFIPIEMPVANGMYNYVENHIYYGEGYDYYTYTGIGIYGYDIATNTLTKVLDWMNSDITLSESFSFLPITPEKMARIYMDGSGYNMLYSIMNHVPDEEIPDKTYLSIGYIYPYNDRYLSRAVSGFNANNDFYRITLTNYYNVNSEVDPTVRLNTAIAAGNGPDILFMNDYLSALSYSNKDMLVDLTDYLNEYESLSESMLPFVKNAEIKGKLTYFPTGFIVNTLIGKTANIGDKGTWTFGDMLEMYKSGKTITHDLSKNTLNTYTLDKIIADCVDYSTASCDFNKQGFKDFIELMKLLPDSYDNSQDYGTNREQILNERYEAHRKDEILLASAYVLALTDYINPIINNFRDAEVTAIGYPTINGDVRGDYVNTCGFSVLNSSENIDVAWQFIMYCLSDHFTNFTLENGYNVSTTNAIDRCNSKYYGLMTSRFYDDFNHIGKDYDAFVDGVDGIHITYNEWFDYFNDYIKYVENYVPKDNDIRNIITDELSDYYTANKNIDDVIKVIESRISVYLSEIWG